MGHINHNKEKTNWHIDRKAKASLTRINSSWNVLRIFLDWLIIILVITASLILESVFAYFIGLIIVGSRQQSLSVFLHDGAHGLLIRNRKLNNLLSEVLLAWPLFTSMRGYRSIHLLHHKYLNTQLDPDWARNQPGDLKSVKHWKEAFSIVCGLKTATRSLSSFLNLRNSAEKTRQDALWHSVRILFYVVVASLVSLLSLWQEALLYWVAPFLFYSMPVFRFRGISEHWGLENDSTARMTRTIIVNPVEAFLVYPNNINYHFVHHLYPGIPYRKLPEAYSLLIQNKWLKKNHHTTKGVFGVIKEIRGSIIASTKNH